MIRVYQISLGTLAKEINKLGWDKACKEYPEVKAYLDCSTFGSTRWTRDYWTCFKHTASIVTDDLDRAFEIGNIGPQSMIVDGILDHSLSVGDLLQNDENEFFMVNSIGFEKVLVY